MIGMMGVGKSTIGPLLAARLGCPFLDTDAEIERRAGTSIAEIFATAGEARFRELEAEAIADASTGPAVIALGGGAIAQPGALERLQALGDLVYLRASPEVLLARIGSGASRPMLAGLDREARAARLAELLEARRDAYEAAQHQVDANAAPDVVVGRILALLTEQGS